MEGKKPVVLLILDGWGLASEGPGNVITAKNAPNMFSLMAEYPSTKLAAAGEAVGLPPGEDGNSEVGHLNLGAGRIVAQSQPRITLSIVDGSFFRNAAFLKAIEQVKQKNSALHLMGLVGSGGVHAYNEHLLALLQLARKHDLKQVYLHLFTDGRDSPPNNGVVQIRALQQQLAQIGVGEIVTLMGRYYAMDRDMRWERTAAAYLALTEINGVKAAEAAAVLEENYRNGITDEFLKPVQLGENIEQTRVKNGDGVIFFNFRVDRPRQLTKAFVMPNFESAAVAMKGFDPYETEIHKKHLHQTPISIPFKRGVKLTDLVFVTMTEYEEGLPVEVAFPKTVVKNTLGEVVAKAGLTQLRLAETEKERFVTHYFSGIYDLPFKGENRLMVASPVVATYDLKPAMSTDDIVNVLLDELMNSRHDFFVVNIACPDMVGHTGNIDATREAVVAADWAVGQIAKAALSQEGMLVVTADHGNAEELINLDTNLMNTEHSINPVPLILVSDRLKGKVTLREGILGDVAPTILKYLGIGRPVEMTGSELY